MTNRNEIFETDDAVMHGPARFAYIKPTDAAEARRQGIIPKGIKVPDGMKLYVLHAVDGSVLGFTDAWDSAYGAAVQNEFTPLSVH
ncbi:MAG TPA: DUF1150 family protein [Rhizomicrobium sp.]|nr:DUF1150 family protein [Rhizomicrobium sp.]